MRTIETNKQNSTNANESKKHISTADLNAFKEDSLNSHDLEKFLEHIGSCDYCADLLANSMEEELVSAPVDMKENIFNKG